jgi:hypothetical protein
MPASWPRGDGGGGDGRGRPAVGGTSWLSPRIPHFLFLFIEGNGITGEQPVAVAAMDGPDQIIHRTV